MSSRIKDFEKLSPAKQKLLLTRLRRREEAEQRAEGIPRSPLRETGGPFPLSFAQQRLWFIDRMAPGSSVYNVADALLLEGRLDVRALERTLGALVERHEVLRTIFDAVDGRPVQVILPPADDRVPIPLSDLSGLDPERADAEARRLAEAEAVLPFDVPRGPHLRTRLVRLPTFLPDRGRWLALLTMHHIVSDGWSMGVLVRELGAFYRAFAGGEPAVLPELPVQYPDFADWQRRTLQGEVLEEHLRWWRERLAGAPPTLDLPADHPRPPVQGHRGAAFRNLLPAETAAAAGALAREHTATPFMVLLAAFALHLARHAGQDDIVVGSPVANRNRLDTEGLLGFFVNTLVLRVDAEERPARTFVDLLDEVRGTTLGAYGHQDLPFERLVEELKPERDLSRSPLFQITFTLQNAPVGDLELPGLTLVPLPLSPSAAAVDLSLDAAETPEGIATDWRYDIDLFEAPTVRRLADRFAVLLRAALADPARPLESLPLLPETERDQILIEWSAGPAAGEIPLFPDQFAAWVERAPEAPAVCFGDEVWTYAELAARAGGLSRTLRTIGVEPESRVGICLERSPDLVASMLAALGAGMPFVPLDPGYPVDRLAYMAADAEIAVLLTTRALAERVPLPEGSRTVFLEEIRLEETGERVGGSPAVRLDPDGLAYVLYTSGSTGRPKGVMVPHQGVANLGALQRARFGVLPDSRMLQFASPSFDASVFEVILALGSGASLRLAPREALLPGPDFARHLAAWGITHAILSPSALAVTPAEDLPALACLIVGGEACSPVVAARWSAGRLLVNAYGPTEATICATAAFFPEGEGLDPVRTPIGHPLAGLEAYVVDRRLRAAPVGVPGELWLGGRALARGYHRRPDLTAGRFVPHPFTMTPGARLYRTGDLVRWRPDGAFDFLGRTDRQVKVRGVRIEPGEIEGILSRHPGVREVAVDVRVQAGDRRLVAWVVLHPESSLENPKSALRAWAADHLPEALVPTAFVLLPELPVTPSGKVDREALPDPDRGAQAAAPAVPRAGLESLIAGIWREVLGVGQVGREESFFDLGGHSLLLVEVQSRLRDRLRREVPILDLFRYPDVASLAAYLAAGTEEEPVPVRRERPPASTGSRDIAVIALSCRFPGAASPEAFWENLRAGVESIRFFADEELLAAGVDPALLADPDYVRASGVLDEADRFDAPFFDISPREAQIMDPQQRVILECAAEALERAGQGAGSPALAGRRVGVFAGTGMSVYGISVASVPGVDGFEATLANDKDFIATRIAYELDLRGPAVSVQTACSTSLVAVHLACKALLDSECELALAGGVTIQFPQVTGYLWREGGITSPDGHNRAFDARARGTVGGNGAGMVVLKPLAAALADGDPIHAVIKATALNNDGSEKIGFTAPSERGQAEVIAEAQELAGVPPETIGYVEAHGSATPLGDPIEVAALMRAFRARASAEAWSGAVALGSVKTNVGHTGSAAGVAGLIKTVLALRNREIPPSLWYEEPNPQIDFSAGPFQVATALTPWEPAPGVPRRAGVSSFGLGGTNAHAVLEEAPEPTPGEPGRSRALIALSARTPTALEAATDRLAAFLRERPEVDLGDIAFTLLTGRKAHEHRRIVVATDAADAATALAERDPRRVLSAAADTAPRAVAFVLAGLGEQYPGLARGLYEEEPVFREELDRCAEILAPWLGIDIREALFAGATEQGSGGGLDLRRLLGRGEAAEEGPLDRAEVLQPALFAVEYALARLWTAWGIAPAALIGYSLGEYVAACLAEVFSLEDALRLVTERARWIGGLPAGAMLAVPLPEEELRPWIERTELDLAATNGPRTSVVSGPLEAVTELERRLGEAGLPARRLRTTHAFHSRGLWPVAERVVDLVREIGPRPPRIPLLSNVTGTWMSDEQATDPGAWAEHLLRPVRFAEGIAELWREPGRVLLEIGPGQSLSSLALQHPAAAQAGDPVAVASLPSAYERRHDLETVLGTLGKLWLAGVAADWPAVWAREERRRVELPAYPFERQRYWLQGGRQGGLQAAGEAPTAPALPGSELDRLSREAEALLETVRGAAGLDPDGMRAALAAIEERAQALSASLRPGAAGPTSAALSLHPRPGLRTPYSEPATELERTVTGLWQRLLGIDRVGRHDSFFDLGGDSLLATQALTRVREVFGVDIPLPSLFEDPTPAGAATLIERLRGAAGGETAPREIIPRLPRDGRAFPTSFAQERLWVIDQIEPGSIAYNLPTSLRLLGRLRTELLERVFAEIVRRHETLRTTFASGSGGPPVQIIHRPAPVSIPLIDLAALPSETQEPEVRRLAVEEGSRPFDLARGPILRIRLLRLAAEEHGLLLTLHHIASDGWSSGVLVQEFAALYDAFSHGRPSPLPGLPVQYADYAAWQRQVFQGPEIAASLEWWSRQLAEAPVLELPTDRPRPAVQGTGGGFVRLEIPGRLGMDLEALARQEGATLFMVVTAVFQVLLSRLSGQEDLTLGTPVANRHRTEVEGLIGFFVNTLVLRTDLSGDPPFRELLARVRRVSIEALEHGEVPFSQIVETLRPERSLSHTPLFQVMFQLANAPGGTLEIPGLRFEGLEAPIDSAMFDLNLTVTETPDGLSAGLEYRTDLFDRETIERLLERYAGLLAAVVVGAAGPEVRVSELPLLTEGERQAMREWDLTPWPPLPSHTLPPGEGEPPPSLEIRIADQARRTSDAPALVHGGQTWTYGAVHDRAARLAGGLRRLGVGPGSRVGICAGRSREMVEAVLASLLAGAAYVPFDPAYPAERLAFMLEDSRIAVLLTQEKLLSALPPFDGPTVLLDEEIADAPAAPCAAAPDDLAYVIYTSGSTGRPKGVAMTRGALVNLLIWQERSALRGPARTLQYASLSFDVSFQEIVSTWVTGGTLVLVDEETRRDPFALLALLDRERVERLFLPFVALRQLAEAAETAGGGTVLRDVVTAGEQLQVTRAVRDWLGRMPGVRLHNQYGPTESHVVTALTLEGDPETWAALPAIGRPLPNVPIRVLDARLHPLPIGVRGELCIGGVAVARGYVDRPDLTAERFVPDPLSDIPGARLYRTGDLARWRRDGNLDYLGRRDHQVKVRGVRVEPGEVEAVLEEQPDVRQAVVLAVPEPGSEALRLVAWYVGIVEAADLRAFLQDRLPAAIVPSLFVPLEAFPVTPSGKVDRLALSRGDGLEGQAGPATFTPPRTPTEQRLAGLWRDLLGVPQVGVEDNFFELGGHSLLATQLVSRLREAFRVEIPQRLIFEAPTLGGLARALDPTLDPGTAPAADLSTPIEPVPGEGPFPLSFSQERLWLIDQIEPGGAAYNIPAFLRLSGPLRPEILTTALGEIVRRHATLRTTYTTRDGAPVQVIAPPAPFILPVIDLSGLSDRLEHAGRVATEIALHPFDLARGPILRASLLRLGEADHVFLCTIHHIATDGWSTGLLIRELLALYDAFSQGLPSPLAALPVRYADYAVWQRRTYRGEALAEALDWWRDQLAEVPVLELPTDHPRTAAPRAAGATEPLLLPGGTAEALQALGRGEGATLFMVLMAGFQALLARHSGQTDITVGTPVAGRDRTELEGLIGFFVNTLVVRTDLSGGPSFRELLGRVRRASLGAFAHQQVPFEKLVGELSPERNLAQSPLFQVLFVLQNTPGAVAEQMLGLTAEPFEADATAAKLDLTLSLAEEAGGLGGGVEYRTALFDPSTIRRLLDHFAILLAGAVADPDRPLAELRLMDAAEERLLQTDLNRAERIWANPVAVHDLFTRQARQTPEKIAAVGPQGAMTYREIDERSTALAARIRNALPGAQLDLRIGLLADPDPQVLVGMIGILAAGGGFVPIDPRFPDDRLAWMLEDSACAVLVTRQRHRARVAGLARGIGGLRHILCLDDEEMEAAGKADGVTGRAEPRDPRELRSLAYIVYTSGSTGRPKGVQISHESLVPMLLWGCAYLGLDESTRVLQNLSFGFDFGIFEHLTTVLAGGTLVFSGEAAGDPAELAQEIVRHEINTLHATPAFARELAATGETLDGLRIVHLGGEALSPEVAARIREAAPRAILYNGYGPTEATVNSSIFRVGAPDDPGDASWPTRQTIPIGRRSADNALYLLDRTGRLVPFGAPGELHVGGIGVARGYLNRPELTAERFVPDPFGGVFGGPGGRLFRTGDLVRYLSDGGRSEGDIEFLGRIDQQVKIRGFRVEPGEIETLLSTHPEVRAAAVVVGEDAAGKRLVACVVLDPGSLLAPSDLRAWLGERLPAPMVPAVFLVLDALPLTPNGKVDRRALARLAAETTGAGVFEAPRTPAEELLAGLWTSLLRVGRVGVHDDFFALGGHSLLATQLVSRVRELFGVEIPLRALFEAPTLSRLAARIEAEGGSRRGALSPQALPPITPVPRDAGPLPLSFAQERLWFLDQLDPGTSTLNLPFSARLRLPLEDALLARALDAVVRRHEVLRTTFGSADGQPCQRIAPALHVPLPVVDLRGLAPRAREREVSRLESEETLLPFDLAHGPLVRARVVRTGETERLFLITLHHIVADGWSLGLLMRELRVLYESSAAGAGQPSPLPELPVQYVDYAAWQRRWLGGEALEAQIAYWRSKLGGTPPVLDLPADRPRPAVQTWRGGSLTHILHPGLTGRLAALARREGATLFMVLLAGFQILLARLSGEDDVLVGTPVAGRVRAETEELIGCFLNNLALRTDLAGSPSFRELLGRARATALEAYEHQDVPFERVLEELRVQRDLSRTSLFQVFLNMLNFPTEEGGLGGTDDEGLTPEVPSKFDLTIYAAETSAGLRLELVYNADLFDHARVAGMAAQLQALLAQAAEEPGRRIDDLSLVTAAARSALPDPSLPLGLAWRGSISQALTASAARRPDKVAVVDGVEAWTWAEVEEGSRRLAHRLRAAGLRTGDVAAVWAHRGAGLLRGVLGASRAGAAVMILDPDYPASRLVDYLRSGWPQAWIGIPGAPVPPPEVLAALDELGCACRLDLPPGPGALADVPASGPEVAIDPPIGPDDAAVLTFTSGSTGRPKGVVGRHGPLTAFYPWIGERFGITADDRFGMLSALSHDPLQRDLFTPVWFGATLCVPDPERIGAPGYLAEWVRRERISVLHLTPAMLELLTSAAEEMPSLRLAFVVGDLLKRSDVARLQRLAPALTCVNLYGSTETQRSVAWFVVPRPGEPGAARVREAIPLGRGMEGVQVLVLGRSGRLAGIGELGEIHLRSGQLALGYLGDPALTAERFLPDREGGRIYRTGDQGRYLPDGNAEFAGRADVQVKIRGFRIEPGEIEAALASYRGVQRCAVVAWAPPGRGDRRLVAYVVPEDGADLAPADLRAFLGERLPAYMVPVDWVTLAALPLTRTGKLDRRALPAPERLPAAAGPAPRTEAERELGAIWSELLGLEAPGREDDFFDLGGHSLLATQLLSRIFDRFGIELPVRAVFERPTIAGLAELVAATRPETALPPLVRRPAEEDPPLSFAQQRLWFLQQLDPGGSAYNMYQALRLEGELDEAALAGALREVVRRQEVLRSRFVTRGTRTVQAVSPVPGTVLPVIDLASLPEKERVSEAERLVRQEAQRPFDIERGPVLRAVLLRLAPAERRLIVAMHHIVSDGWSMGVFVEEMTTLYEALVAGRPSPLPELPIQYGDFARWQREWLAGPTLEREVAWWRGRLEDAPPLLDLPLDRPRPALHGFHGRRRSRRLDPAASEVLLRLGREREATPFMTGLALYAALLQRHTGAADLVVGTPIANRNRQEIEGLIGFFANTLALRVDLSGAPGFGELLNRVRETALGAYSHQDVPFEKLVEELAPARSLQHAPLFQVMFVMGGAPLREMGSERLRISVLQIESEAAKFDLTLMVEEGEGGLGLTFGYNSDLFFATTIERLLEHAETLAAGLGADPARPIAGLPLLGTAEQHQLLREWNDTAEAVPGTLLHALFEARAAEAPDAPAVLDEEAAVSYGELDARANRLAHRLRGLGVGPEVRVGLCAERSVDLILGLLGTLKAGGAWVPMDPAWPAERLALLPADAGLRLLLTQERLVDRLAAADRLDLLLLDRDREEIDRESDAPIRPEITPENAAYVIYTSGSTGTPNGVLVPHRAAVNLALEGVRRFGASRASRVLQVGSPGFDVSVLEIFLALAGGAALCIGSEDERRDPALLAERIARQEITVAALTPTIVGLLPEGAARGLTALSVGGEAAPAGLAPRWASGRRFLNCYGPTEATVYATVERLSPEERGEPPIGRPVVNAEAVLLDASLGAVPIGVAGELCLGGAGLARGYLGRPDRTAAKFIPHPCAALPGARLYRTGDLARQRPDGRFEYLGRIDQQVKVRGVRIEPGEIETALLRHSAVRAAVVAAREDGAGDRVLVAWVAADPASAPTDLELRAFLAGALPEALVPSAFVVLAALPRNASGKVDRRALPAPRRAADTSDTAGVEPRNQLEHFLADLWKEALGIERIGVHDNFFELGGSSIKAALLTNLLQERLGEYVYVVALFDAPTIARLAVHLEEQYPAAVARLTGQAAGPAGPAAVERVDVETLARFRSLIEPLPPSPSRGRQNRRAVFVLSPPRSGSTLLRVMLAGHPGLFAPPELELLGFNTLRERKEAFSGRYSFWAEGIVRALMALEACSPEQAWEIMEEAEAHDLSVRDFYGWMQERLGRRLLVDKTPSYALDPAVLARAEQDFEEPLYIHLLRHPHAMIASFEKARLEQVFFRQPHQFSRRQLAELIWVTSQQNILAHLHGIPAERQIRLGFEDLVRDPRAAMERVCDLLGLDFHPAMLEPYKDPGRRMTDGIHALSRMVGDVKFHEHRQVDAGVADRWREEIEEDFLGSVTWEVAGLLGYERPEAARPSPLVRLQAGGPGRPFFCVHPVGGNVLAYSGLARELAPDRPSYGLQSLGLDGGTPQATVEEMAATYLEEILKVQPRGPWLLGGWSFGGVVAWEMAQHLRRQGGEVDLLALIDVPAPGRTVGQPLTALEGIDDAALVLGHLVPELDPTAAEALQSEARELGDLPPDERLEAILAAAQRLGALPSGLGTDQVRALLRVYRSNVEAARRYVPQPYAGRVLLVRASRGLAQVDPLLGWGDRIAGEREIVDAEGDHYTIWKGEALRALARVLRDRLLYPGRRIHRTTRAPL